MQGSDGVSTWASEKLSRGQSGLCFIFWMPKEGAVFLLKLLIRLGKLEELPMHKQICRSEAETVTFGAQWELRTLSSGCCCGPCSRGCGWESVRSCALHSPLIFFERRKFWILWFSCLEGHPSSCAAPEILWELWGLVSPLFPPSLPFSLKLAVRLSRPSP